MGERLLCKQEVIGSNPFTSTTVATKLWRRDRCCASNAESTGGRKHRRLEKIWRDRGPGPLGPCALFDRVKREFVM